MPRRTFQTQTSLEALLVEPALLLARQLQKAADDAPDGQVLAAVESAAVPAGRELTRKAVEAALQQQAPAVEKTGDRTGPAPSATSAHATKGDRSGPS